MRGIEHYSYFQSRETEPVAKKIQFGRYVPEYALTNDEIDAWNVVKPSGGTLRGEDILEKTGIAKRYVAGKTENPVWMGAYASNEALKGSGDVDFIFASTSYPTGEHIAKGVADRLQIKPKDVLDVYAACSGFTEMLHFIKQHEDNFFDKDVLLVSTEKYSPTLVDLRTPDAMAIDPSLAQTIFSDGAVALYFRYGRDMTIETSDYSFVPFDTTNPEDVLNEEKNPLKMPINESLMVSPYISVQIPQSKSGYFEQDGKAVLKAVGKHIPKLIEGVIDQAEENSGSTIRLNDLLVIPHQGSKPMVTMVNNRVPYRVAHNYENGNLSSASIPDTLNRVLQNGELRQGDRAVLAGFGAGLYASVAVVRF